MSISPEVRIVTDIASPAPELLETLATLDLPTFGHILEEGFARGIRNIVGGEKLTVGRVVTVKLIATDSRLVHYVTRLVRPGDFVVIDNGHNTTHASLGGGVSGALAAAGVVGAAVSGTVTDVVELRESGLAIYATGLAPLTTRSSAAPIQGAINVPVSVGGVTVRPGMVAMADENGVLFAESSVLAALIQRVRTMMAWEPPAMAQVRAGTPLSNLILPADDLEALNALAGAGKESR